MTINTYTIYKQKEPGMQAASALQKYKIGLICGVRKPIQIVTCRYKIGFL